MKMILRILKNLLTERERKLIKLLNEAAKLFPHGKEHQRLGQALFNAAHYVDRDYIIKIGVGTDLQKKLDPYYDDRKIEAFIEGFLEN